MGRSRYAMSERKLARWTKEGRGIGRLSEYRPWLTIHDVPSHGLSVRVLGTTTKRVHHLLSGVERAVFMEADWSPAVVDIREQFPLPRDVTRRIAASMGVRHPRDGGVDIVMTTDFLLDVRGVDGEGLSFPMPPGRAKRPVALSIKADDADLTRADLDKLEIERRYWRDRGVPWHLLFRAQLPENQWRKLMWLHEWFTLDFMTVVEARLFAARCDTVLANLGVARDATAGAFMARMDGAEGWAPGTSLAAIRHLSATRRVIVDPTTLYDAWGPLTQFSPAFRKENLERRA